MSNFAMTLDQLPGHGPAPPLPEILQGLETLALQGDGEAARRLGDAFRTGDYVPRDPRRAFRWYVRGAFRRDAEAMNNLGSCYYNGFGCATDCKQARHWWWMAANWNSLMAKENYGLCLLKGIGGPEDRTNGLRFLREAGLQGSQTARDRLEEMRGQIDSWWLEWPEASQDKEG